MSPGTEKFRKPTMGKRMLVSVAEHGWGFRKTVIRKNFQNSTLISEVN